MWTVIQFIEREIKYHLSQYLLIILSYPSLSLLISHNYEGSVGRQLNTLNFSKVNTNFLSAFIFKFCKQ